MPPAPAKRYLVEKKQAGFERWRFIDKIQSLSKGKNLRIEVLAPATLHWSTDNGQTTHNKETRDTKLGVYVLAPRGDFHLRVRVDLPPTGDKSKTLRGENFRISLKMGLCASAGRGQIDED